MDTVHPLLKQIIQAMKEEVDEGHGIWVPYSKIKSFPIQDVDG